MDATITKLGWTTYMTSFLKWPPATWNYVFAYYSASRIDRDNFWLLNPCFSGWRIQWWHWQILVNYWLTWNSKWLCLKSTEITSFGPCAQWTHLHPPGTYKNLIVLIVTGTYTNMNSGCHNHQIGMEYGHQRSEIAILSITQQLGQIETTFFKWGHNLVTWQAAIFLQVHGQVAMTLETTGFVVCHQ